MKLFIIPWLVMGSMVRAQNVGNGGVAAPNPQFVDIPFYQFLQRQNQINNAILLNNAMLANSLGAVPKEHQIRLPNTMPFSAANLQAGLPTSPPLFQNFPHPIPTVPATGLYDVLHHGLPVNPVLVPTPTPPQSTTTSVVVESTSPAQQHAQKTVEIVSVASKEDDVKETESRDSTEESKKISGRSTAPDKQSADTIRRSSLRELVEEIGYETYGTTKQKVKLQTTTPKPRQDVYKLLRTLNLTEEETDDFVSHVEKVVREELVRKLAETRLSALNNTRAHDNNKTTSLSPNVTVEATTVAAQREVLDRVEPPLRRTKTDKELLLYLPRKKAETEIKHHPPRVEEKASEDKTDSVEAEILTSQMHIPIEEKLVDDKGEDDFSGSEENAKIEETIRTTTTETTSTTTVVSPKPPTSQPTRPPPTLRIWDGVNGTVIDENTRTERRSYGGADADLLGIGLATGAPLDLENEGGRVVPYRIRNIPRASSPDLPPVAAVHNQPHARMKNTVKPKTAFERLAVDYKERLTGAGDMDKILKTLYSNAYIALVDAKEAPNVRLPLNIRRAELQYAQRLQ